MEPSVAAKELEEDQRIRIDELVFLDNVCENLPEEQQDKMRRSMLLMLYAHFEGFVKMALDIYCRHINEETLKCCEVQPEIATWALHDMFKAIRTTDKAKNFLPEKLQNSTDIRVLAIERTVVSNLWTLEKKVVSISDKYIDLESNLKPHVLRKNLYRLGLPHDMFENREASIGKLLGRRNNIAHGQETKGIDESTYSSFKKDVIDTMGDIRMKINECISKKKYLNDNYSWRAESSSGKLAPVDILSII